jgi:transposase
MPKGKVTEQEIFVMKGMYSDGMSIEDISKELSRSEATIEKYLDIKEEVVEAEAEAEKTETYTNRNNTTMFIRSSAAKNNNGVTIMTDSESSRSDMTRSKRTGKVVNKLRNNIHTISDDNG